MTPNIRQKLLITTSAFPRRQGEQRDMFMLDLCRHLALTYEVFVLVPHDKGFPRKEEYEGMHIIKHPQSPFNAQRIAYGSGILPNIRKNKLLLFAVPFYFLYQLHYIRRIIRKEKIQLLNAHWLIPQGLTAVIYKRFFNRKIKLVVTVHGTDLLGLSKGLGGKLQRYVMKHSNRIITVSNAMKGILDASGCGEKTFVRSMGIDTQQFLPGKKKPDLRLKYRITGPFLLYVGAVIEPKGIRHLMQALPSVLKQFPEARLMVVGEGNLMSDMQQLAAGLNISSSVIFTGALSHNELPELFASADLFILPSLSEGFGLVVAEAMSSGTIVIASDLPALHDLVIPQKTGFFVPAGDSVALAEQINYVLQHRDELDVMRGEARQHIITGFSWEVVAREYAELLNR